ncbi:Crp/Fnr family transcriptional regulator [Streptosporangium sp. NPDC001559]|uniref:Crp/Fnr family transcriptional regulator n=1 Tax=Streptosporangium sp. NPDC001559 TaxID=3366187 RepID=UPI0036E89F3F
MTGRALNAPVFESLIPRAHHGSFWRELDKEDRARLVMLAGRTRRVAAGETLFHRGSTGSEVLIVLEGFVKVMSMAGETLNLQAIRAPGQLLGEQEALQRGGTTVRRVSAQALTKCRVLVVTSAAFRSFLEEHSRAWEALARELGDRLRESETRVEGMAADAANRRLARALVSLLDPGEVLRVGTGPLQLRLSQADLASWIGTSRETVERILRDWRTRGLVETGYRSIRVMSPTDMFRIAGLPGLPFASAVPAPRVAGKR